MVEKLWQYVKPFSSNTGMWQTEGHTEGRTELLYHRAIKIQQLITLLIFKDFPAKLWTLTDKLLSIISCKFCLNRLIFSYFIVKRVGLWFSLGPTVVSWCTSSVSWRCLTECRCHDCRLLIAGVTSLWSCHRFPCTSNVNMCAVSCPLISHTLLNTW